VLSPDLNPRMHTPMRYAHGCAGYQAARIEYNHTSNTTTLEARADAIDDSAKFSVPYRLTVLDSSLCTYS